MNFTVLKVNLFFKQFLKSCIEDDFAKDQQNLKNLQLTWM